jgi:hypothetical protein
LTLTVTVTIGSTSARSKTQDPAHDLNSLRRAAPALQTRNTLLRPLRLGQRIRAFERAFREHGHQVAPVARRCTEVADRLGVVDGPPSASAIVSGVIALPSRNASAPVA